TVLLATAWIMWWKPKGGSSNNGHKLPPGSTGWPLIGENIAFFRAINSTNNHPRQFSIEREKRSNLFGSAQTVVSVDPEFNKYVLQNEGRFFQAKYPSTNNNLVGKYGMVTVHGELQRKLHATAVNLLRSEKMGFDFMDDIQNAFSTAMDKWVDMGDIHLQHECHKASIYQFYLPALILNMGDMQVVLNLMGKKLLDLPPAQGMEGIYQAFKDFAGALVCLPINIPGFAYSKGMKAREIIVRTIHECIKERREHPEVKRNDLLTKLVKEGSLSDEIIADFLVFFLFAGYETSSTVMAFAVMFLTQNPRALQELRVIKETLRVGNVAPLIPREAKQDIKMK
ncbi:hypothetical protein KI387_014012, partial [Taxus chinensis]